MDFDIRRWLDENLGQYPPRQDARNSVAPMRQPQYAIPGGMSPVERARAYVERMAIAIEGENGSGKALNVACVLINGFDLSFDQARPIFETWSARCLPPWNDTEIDHKLSQAAEKDQDKPRGYLLNREQEGRPNHPQRNGARPMPCQATPTASEATQERGNDSEDIDDSEDNFNPPNDGIDYDDTRPEVQITSNEHLANLEVFSIITEDPRVFQRGGILVEDIRSTKEQKGKISNNLGSFDVVPISVAKLRHVISQNVKFFKMVPFKDEDDEIDYKKVLAHTPDWCVKTMHGWGGYPGFKALEGIAEIPILHADGSIFDTAGYDPETRMIYEPSAEFPKIACELSKKVAEDAASRLLDLVSDFPWEEIDNDKGSTHKAAWLSSLMTVLFRHLIDGCCPAFLFSANIAGSGKSKLADIISIIATGRTMPRTPYADNEEEMKKSVIAILMEAKPFVLFDNIQNGGALGGSTITTSLTSRVYSDRLLCTNKTPKFLVNTVFFATGNQINLKGDSLRRFVIGKLKSPLESPELRSEFKIKEKILNYVSRNRVLFVNDALILMKSYIQEGMPKGNLISMGSYDEWSDVIREAVYWSTGSDPVKSQHHLKKVDKQSLERAALIKGWAELPPAHDENGEDIGLTMGQALSFLEADTCKNKYGMLRGALSDMNKSGKGDYPAPQTIGRMLGLVVDIVIGGIYLKKITDHPDGNRWKICKIEAKPEETDDSENLPVPF